MEERQSVQRETLQNMRRRDSVVELAMQERRRRIIRQAIIDFERAQATATLNRARTHVNDNVGPTQQNMLSQQSAGFYARRPALRARWNSQMQNIANRRTSGEDPKGSHPSPGLRNRREGV